MSSSGTKPKSVKKRVYNVASRYQNSDVSSREKSPLRSRKEASKSSSQDMTSILSSSSQGSQGMTSTPACKGIFNFPSFNASAVTDTQGHLAVPSLKERIVPSSGDTLKKGKQKMADVSILPGPVVASYKKNDSQFNEALASDEMDILYAEYLQSVFLENEARKALKARSSAAAETIHKLLTLITQYLHKVKSRKVLAQVLSILIEWNNHCQKQHDMLKPVYEIIPNLEEQYRCVAEAIDASKHKLPIKDVILPDSDEIQKILQKMNGIIATFFESVPNCTDVISLADALQKYVDFGECLAGELKNCAELLIRAQELCFTEASLALGCENL